jgi:dihydroflavonol-4-reductase
LKTLVTGATGFVGAVLVRRLVERGEDVRIFRRRTSSLDLLESAANEVEHVIGDLRDPFSIQDAMHGIDRVYHAAAYLGYSSQLREKLFETNVRGTARIVNAALAEGVDRLVYTSSMAALGGPEPAEDVVDESNRWSSGDHASAYATSKHAAELEVYRGQEEGLEAVIVNPSLIFGPEDLDTGTMRFVKQIRKERLPAVPPGQINVVDVLDVVTGHIAAMELGTPGERYFLGSEDLSWRCLANRLAEALEVTPPQYTIPETALVGLGLAAEAVSLVTRRPPRFSREMARAAVNYHAYSNRKTVENLGVEFRPFTETAHRIAAAIR